MEIAMLTTRGVLTGVILSGLFFLSACVGVEPQQKGDEDDFPQNGSFDSWYTPTEHGELPFGSQAAASLTADQSYHVWDFTVDGPAHVALTTGSSNLALDTVMYLYRQRDDSWGSYYSRNDDFGTGVFSHIDAELDSGTYRVVVKGYKRALRGEFFLQSECDGTGCPSRDWSVPTHYGDSCVPRVLDVLLSEYLDSEVYILATDGLDHIAEPLRAPIQATIDDIAPWDDDEWAGELDVTWLEGGTLVYVSDGEDVSIGFLFDKLGRLVLQHVTDQTPWTYWYCGEEDELGDLEPDGFCVDEMLRALPHKSSDTTDSRGTVAVEDGEAPQGVLNAAWVYRGDRFGAADVPLNYSYTGWDSGGQVSLWSESTRQRDYVVTYSPYTHRRLVVSESDAVLGTSFVCRIFVGQD